MLGIYPIYKPKGPTSHDIIYRVRKVTGEKRVGHAGTLDPLASGVLVVAVGREFTKQLEQHVQGEKEYIATIKLGEISTTDDEQGEKIPFSSSKLQHPNQDEIEKVLQTFIGTIEQIPPVYSAIKVKGMPAHRRIRRGQTVELPARTVEIKAIELLDYEFPMLKIQVKTGKGVYIRSLARDIGQKLNTGAYLADLERTQVGAFRIEQSLTLDQLQQQVTHSDSAQLV